MSHTAPPHPVPYAHSLKRHVLQHAPRLWCAPQLARMLAAPIYFFPDAEKFDSDALGQLSLALLNTPFQLPHASVVFEVIVAGTANDRCVTYCEAHDGHIDVFLFRYIAREAGWTDTLLLTRFPKGDKPEIVVNTRAIVDAEVPIYVEALAAVLGRSLALLSLSCPMQPRILDHAHRTKAARGSKEGWSYRLADIDPSLVSAAAARLVGTHASPRWHIRRGHFRQLPDGRRIFVRECEVGDIARGGVIKDYRVAAGKVA